MKEKKSVLPTFTVAVIAAVVTVIFAVLIVMSVAYAKRCESLSEQYSAELSVAEAANRGLMTDKDALNGKVEELEGSVSELEGKLTDAGAYYAELIASLRGDVELKASEIAALQADIEKYRTVFDIDVLEQARLIDELVSYIEGSCPVAKVISENGEGETVEEWYYVSDLIDEEYAKVVAEGIQLYTEEELAESGITAEELSYKLLRERVFAREDVVAANISVYYEDIITGYHFDHNADKAYPSASVIKAPYVMSVLKAVSADEKAMLAAIEEGTVTPEICDTDGDGVEEEVYPKYSDPKFDLSEVVAYDSKTMAKSGSGVIVGMEDGTEFTFLQFAEYAVKESDNVAYSQLRARFGYDTMTALARSVGANISGSTMTAKGAGKLFRAIYDFTETDETYGPILAEALRTSNHRVMIPLGVYGTSVLHKYGWDEDSYHDAGIVLAGDHPYIITVFSDMDVGGDEVNEYIRGIVSRINRLHQGFYTN